MPSNWRTTRANAIAARCRQQRHLMNSPAMQDSHVGSGIASIQHGNVRLPRWSERSLQPVLVTVDTHRIHRSGAFNQANSNDGAVFFAVGPTFRNLSEHQPRVRRHRRRGPRSAAVSTRRADTLAALSSERRRADRERPTRPGRGRGTTMRRDRRGAKSSG